MGTWAGASCGECAARYKCVVGRVEPARQEHLQRAITLRRYPKGSELAREGESLPALVVVKMGAVFVMRRGLEGRRLPIGMLGRGGILNLMGYFGEPPPFTGIAATATHACSIPHEILRQLATLQPRFEAELLHRAAHAIVSAANWSGAARVPGVLNQLAYTMMLLADEQGFSPVELPSHTAMAHLLGTTRESVARALSSLRAEGSIRQLGRLTYEIHRTILLQRLAGRRAHDHAR